jgi:heptosyltransferase-1
MKVLIVKLSAIGDIIQSFAAVQMIRQQAPNCQIDWVVEKRFAGLVRSVPIIDGVHCFDRSLIQAGRCSLRRLMRFIKELRRQKYDLVIDLQGNCKSALINFMAKSSAKVGFGPRSIAEWPNLISTQLQYEISNDIPRTQAYMELAARALKLNYLPAINEPMLLQLDDQEKIRMLDIGSQLTSTTNFMVCFSSNWKNKKLSKKTMLSFLEKISNNLSCNFHFVWKTLEEKIEAEWFATRLKHSKVLGDLSIPLWQAIMKEMDLVISVDSCGLHLAAAAGVPTFSFFGPSSAFIYKPLGKQHGYVQGKCPYQIHFTKRCPRLRTCASGACLKNLQGEELGFQFLQWWKQRCSSKLKSI